MTQQQAIADIHAEAFTIDLSEAQAFLKVGDKVLWRGGFGMNAPKVATVTGVNLIHDGDKNYTTPVSCVPWSLVGGRAVLVVLDNGHWAYDDQIEQVQP